MLAPGSFRRLGDSDTLKGRISARSPPLMTARLSTATIRPEMERLAGSYAIQTLAELAPGDAAFDLSRLRAKPV